MKCPRCHKVHTCPPVNTEKIIENTSVEIAEYINKQVLKQMKTIDKR
jgi:hypothetical protein